MAKKTLSGSTSDFLAGLKTQEEFAPPQLLDIDEIDPDPENVRSTFRPIDGVVPESALTRLGELADDIHERKLHHPISVVEEPNGRYRIAIGERRWRAFRLNRDRGRPHYERIPAYVRNDLAQAQLRLAQISENIQREDPTDLDIAHSLKQTLEDFPDLQKKDLAKLMNKPASYISRLFALLDPEWQDVIESGVITYSSLLEHFKSLKKETQAKLVQKAKKEGRSLTSGDIKTARHQERISPDVQQDAASVLSAFAPKGETYDPKHAATSRAKADAAQITDHGGEPVLPVGALAFELTSTSKVDMRLTLNQLAILLKSDAVSDDAMSTVVSLALPISAARDAILSIGGEVPRDDASIGRTLVERINSFL